MKHSYSRKLFPPAPYIEMRLGIPDESLKVGPLSALIDSGADITVVPQHYIRRLGLSIEDHGFLRGEWGERRKVRIYTVDVSIDGIRLPAVEVAADAQIKEVLIGRNILNMLRVLLDGPKQIVEITE
jgi:predicted aspartyl protease